MSLAVKKLEDLSNDPTARRIAEDRERDLLAHGHILASTRRLGREEGIAIGREEGIAIGREEGIAIGREEGIAIGRQEGKALMLLTAIEAIADVLGVEITPARRAELNGASVEELGERLASVRRTRDWR